MKTHVRIEEITPEKAAKWLKLNTHNRDLTVNRVKVLTGAIDRGEWKLNPDCIAFSGNGNGGVLLNGQHRLHACVQSGSPIVAAVMYDLEFAAQETMDSGAPRSMGAKLKLRGEKDSNNLAAALGLAWTYDKVGVLSLNGRSWTLPTHQQLFDYLDEYPDVRTSLAQAGPIRKEFGSPAGNWGAYIFLFKRETGDPELVDSFFSGLLSGAELNALSPIYVLRNHLRKQRSLPADRRFGQLLMSAMVIKAFNAWCLNQDIKILRWRHTEDFPKIITKAELA